VFSYYFWNSSSYMRDNWQGSSVFYSIWSLILEYEFKSTLTFLRLGQLTIALSNKNCALVWALRLLDFDKNLTLRILSFYCSKPAIALAAETERISVLALRDSIVMERIVEILFASSSIVISSKRLSPKLSFNTTHFLILLSIFAI